MFSFSYTLTPLLKREIEKIDATRRRILIEQVPRNEELQLRWEANLERAMQASRLTDRKLKRSEVMDALKPTKKPNDYEVEAEAYAKAYEWLNQKWYMNREKVEVRNVLKILSFLPKKTNIDEDKLHQALEFIQVKPEHPVVQSGIFLSLISQLLPEDTKSIKMSIIISILFMYKRGYDFRGLLNLEEYFANDSEHFKEVLARLKVERNLSSYLEYFTQAVSIEAERALRRIVYKEFKNDLAPSFYNLTDRQKEILGMFAKPNTRISNKKVQAAFKISQITASRDLAKLHTLGLIVSSGKGRSVYYQRLI